MVEGDLARLAKLYGIALEYVDQAGDPQIISEETVVAVLTAMGVAAETEQDVSRSIVEREQRDWRRVLPPVYVQRQGQVGQVKVHLPQGQEPRLRILTETEQEPSPPSQPPPRKPREPPPESVHSHKLPARSHNPYP